MNRNVKVLLLALACHAGGISSAAAQPARSTNEAQQVLATAASEEKYAFLVFYKDNGPATRAMVQAVKNGVASRADRATCAFVNVASPAEKALVDRFGVSRAPMPFTVAVAPNGATTQVIPSTISDEQIEESFVTPAMAHCMKSMQEDKLVFICIRKNRKSAIPAAVSEFHNDPEFKGRTVVVPVSADDPAETELVREMEADVSTKGATTVFLAPPGVLVGKFGPLATKQELAAALHKAGECCDDPECKHNQSGKSTSKPAAGAARQSQKPGARR